MTVESSRWYPSSRRPVILRFRLTLAGASNVATSPPGGAIAIAPRRVAEEEIESVNTYAEAALRNALENENGAEREELQNELSHTEMPPEDWDASEDYQLHRGIEILNAMMSREQAQLQ